MRVDHVSLGLLLSPGGSEFAGSRVTAGGAAVMMLGAQLWPVRMPLPVFMDLSAGGSLALTGLDGMPGAAVILRAYVGVGL
jgi:hypothetical protein